MAASAPSRSGFDFGLHSRNAHLAARGHALPKATSTGTTIVGCIYKDGVVLGADTRATEGPIVADKNCEKVRAGPRHAPASGSSTASNSPPACRG
jgi:20S proteasome alpha/beta subunit